MQNYRTSYFLSQALNRLGGNSHRSICRRLVLPLMLAFAFLLPASAFGVTSEELFAEVDSIMREIDILQTNINSEREKYEIALAEHDAAEEESLAAQERANEERLRMKLYQDQLAILANNMYKTGGTPSYLEVLFGSISFEEFLTKWDAVNAISSQGANLVQEAKNAKAEEERARARYEEQAAIAEEKMREANESRLQIEQSQRALQEEAEKISKEAAELQAQEELEREAARQAALAAEAAQHASEESLGLSDYAAESGSGYFQHPLPSGSISSTFGWRDFNGGSFHKGLDLAESEGTPYMAAASGTVIYATNDGGYNGGAGNWVVIAHGNGLVTKYMHSSAVYVQPGDFVERGQTIGRVGNTGDSYGAHLHFQVEYNGVAIDPLLFL